MMNSKIFFVSLGCDKNRVDSEEMLGLLVGSGFSITDDEYEADIIVVNTCCFIDAAKEESISVILEMAKYKKIGKCKRLVVSGCLSERYKDEILKELPEVDAWIGTSDLNKIITACNAEQDISDCAKHMPRYISTGGHYEFLKIAEGCNKRCTYCIIPYIRGNYRSFPMEKLINEAEYLADCGVKELIVVAQETSIYGSDIYKKNMLPELLKKLCLIKGIEWIRVLYCYPEDISEDFLKVMAEEDKICKYIDMPIQHISDNILKRMGRRCTGDSIRKTINKVRDMVPGVVLRTSLITGFPGETEADHELLKEFVTEIKFDHLGVFTYSCEEGTPAAGFDNQIDEVIKNSRRDELMNLQKNICEDNLANMIGREFNVFIEGELPDEEVYIGRTYMDAPDVDGYFYLKSKRNLYSGDFIKAVVTQNSTYDLYGEMTDEFTE